MLAQKIWGFTFSKCLKFILRGHRFKLEFTEQVQGFLMLSSIFCSSPKDLVGQLDLCLPRRFGVCFLWALIFFKVSQISSLWP